MKLTMGHDRVISCAMGDLCRLIWYLMTGLFRSRAALQAEILVLRHPLNVLRRNTRSSLTSWLSKKGITRSFSESAAVIGS